MTLPYVNATRLSIPIVLLAILVCCTKTAGVTSPPVEVAPTTSRTIPSPVGMLPQAPFKSYKVVSRETYERVLSIVFPRDEADRDYDFVLRFEPSFAPESQIIVKRSNRKTEVIEYASLSGNIYRKLNTLIANGVNENAIKMAKLIQVRKTVAEVSPEQARLWRTKLGDSIGASVKVLEARSEEAARGVGTVTIDGTFYSLWYDQDSSDVFFRVLDHEVSDREVTGELQLVQWMNTVRREIALRLSAKR